ncbi:estradiol 17-beta-dehydrogenase 8 [Pectinophora gossypiella]|uniref:estradiol 17-beta-dehydrogenase 8 n=1 Tax=Pectinophora gossypiella TaxID=13191 RepID=UPI00214EA5EB|nr:estradiol 17-beta-dehydrogenase 8 [Pectinophora gossypiella]
MVAGMVAGRLAVVTGAGSGIGRAACQVLSREGATVIAADKSYDSAVDTIKTHTALACGASDIGDHTAVELDVADQASVKNLVQTTLKHYKTRSTIVVNSAGITRDNWMLKLSDEDFDNVMDVNLKGTFLIMRAFAKIMSETQTPGSIINISSIVGKYGNLGQTNYSASKAGVVGMTQSAAQELGKFGIRVNAVLPGFIDTPIIKTVPDKVREAILKQVPLGRLGEATEVAELIAFLASDKSSFITGAAIDITGGY